MAGIRVVVCLPPEAVEDLGGALAEVLAPFELMSGFGLRGIWDWWAIRGGSDGNGFSYLPGFEDDPRLIHDDPRYDGELLPSLPGSCAGGPRGLLDLSVFREMSGRMASVRARAGDPWEAWQFLAPAHPPILPLSHFRTPREGDRLPRSLPQMWTDFTAQPLWQAFFAHPLSQLPELGTAWPLWRHPMANELARALTGEREDFERLMVARFWQPDVLTLDGWWIEDGLHPRHATCDGDEPCPHMAAGRQYQRDIGGYLETLTDDVLLVKLKCHG